MSEKNIVKLLEQISVPLTSSRDCNQAFIVAYDIYSDGYHHSYSEVTRFLLRNQNSEFDNIKKLKQIHPYEHKILWFGYIGICNFISFASRRYD